MNTTYLVITSILLIISVYQQYCIRQHTKYINTLLIKAVQDTLTMNILAKDLQTKEDKKTEQTDNKEVLKG